MASDRLSYSRVEKINERVLYEKIRKLYHSKLVKQRKNVDGSFIFVLTKKGKLKAFIYHFQTINIKKEKWDGKWRLVSFDIPETKKARDALRDKLKKLGFYELQKKAFLYFLMDINRKLNS